MEHKAKIDSIHICFNKKFPFTACFQYTDERESSENEVENIYMFSFVIDFSVHTEEDIKIKISNESFRVLYNNMFASSETINRMGEGVEDILKEKIYKFFTLQDENFFKKLKERLDAHRRVVLYDEKDIRATQMRYLDEKGIITRCVDNFLNQHMYY